MSGSYPKVPWVRVGEARGEQDPGYFRFHHRVRGLRSEASRCSEPNKHCGIWSRPSYKMQLVDPGWCELISVSASTLGIGWRNTQGQGPVRPRPMQRYDAKETNDKANNHRGRELRSAVGYVQRII